MKTYIVPQTESILFASGMLMQDTLNVATGSGSEFSEAEQID